jgi:hypothetical protein
MKGVLSVFSNGNSFTIGEKINVTGDGMVGAISLQGERLVYEWLPARLLSPLGTGAFV